jgi:hypothetical protein
MSRMILERIRTGADSLGIRMPESRACLFLVIALAVSLCSCSRPSPGLLELQASREAVRAAKSWQSGTTAQFPTGQWAILTLESIECPGRYNRTGILHDQHNRSVHEIQFDGTYYNKTDAPRTWSSNPAPEMMVINCGQGPSLTWDGILYDDLDAVQRIGEIRRGKTDKADDVSCVWWEVAPAKGAPPHYSVCVGEDDHLPRTVRSHEHDMNYVYTVSHWNATTVSLPPDIILR